jgi:hypothetical protein
LKAWSLAWRHHGGYASDTKDSAMHENLPTSAAGLVRNHSSREVAQAIDNYVRLDGQILQSIWGDLFLDPHDLDVRVDVSQELCSNESFWFADIFRCVKQLSIEVRRINLAVIDYRQPTNPGPDQVLGGHASEPAHTEEQNPGSAESFLTFPAESRKDHLPSVALPEDILFKRAADHGSKS